MLQINSRFNFTSQNNLFIPFVLFIWVMAIPFKNSIYQLTLASIIFSCVFLIIKHKDYSTFRALITRDRILLYGVSLILLSMTVSNVFGLNPQDAFTAQLKFFYKYVLIFFALLYLHDKKYFSLKLLTLFILLSLSIQSINGIYQQLVSTDIFNDRLLQDGGLTGSFSSRNVFGLFMLISSALFFIHLQTKSVTNKLMPPLILILLSISIFGLLFSYSRASWVAFASFYFIVLFSSKKTTNFLALLLPPFIALLFLLTDDNLMIRLEQLLFGDDSNRFEIWDWAFNSFKENWLLGYGLESWSMIKDVPPYRFVHNSILEVALYLGIIGLFSYVFLSLHILIKSLQCQRIGLFALGIALFVVSLFDHNVIEGKLFLPILTLYAVYVIIASQQNQLKQ